MTNTANPRPLLSVALLSATLLFAAARPAWAQTMKFSVYTDTYSSSDFTTVYSSDTTIDQSIGCTHSNYGNTAGINSPDGRNAYTTGSGLIGNVSIPVNNAAGTYSWYAEASYYCSCAQGPGGAGGGGYYTLGFTPIQHNYPSSPLGQACKVTSWFDAYRKWGAHHAEDVVLANAPTTYGTPVYAMETGTVVGMAVTYGPGCLPQACTCGHNGNYVKVKTTDGYFTVYFHMTPAPGISLTSPHNNVVAGQLIGYLDPSGCQTGPHLHVSRKDSHNNLVNFSIPCVNPNPTTTFDDGSVEDYDLDSQY